MHIKLEKNRLGNNCDAFNWLTDKQFSKDEVEFVKCPGCNADAYKTLTTERSVLGVVKCKSCGLIYINPRLKNPETIYWGEEEAYYEEAKLIFMKIKPHHRDKNYLEDLKIIKKFKPKGNFLDIGTNAGFFLRHTKTNLDWNVFGVEPSKTLSNLGRKYFDLNIANTFVENAEFKEDFFDIVTMTDVFEHIPNPNAILQKIHTILKEDGILFMKVPNGLYNLTKFRLSRLANNVTAYDIFDSYEHLVHYSDSTLNKILNKNGFKVICRKVGKPIQTPCWQKYTGRYYQYPMPWYLDWKNQILRNAFYVAGLIECLLLGFKIGRFAPNIIIIAKKQKVN